MEYRTSPSDDKIVTTETATEEWKPINKAPPNVRLMLGKWETAYSRTEELQWLTTVGVVWTIERNWYGKKYRQRRIGAEDYTHWKWLPPAPSPLLGKPE